MRNKIFSHIFFFLFQIFGALFCGYARNYVMVTWCTGWALYSLIQINKILDKKPNSTDIDVGD